MRIAIALLALLLAPLSMAVDYEFLAGSTDKFITVNMYALDGTPKTGLLYSDMTITYTRNNAAADVDVTEVTMTMGTHTDGGWIQVDATNSPGLYQFALPDAAIATSAESVIFSFSASATFQRYVQASIINVDLRGSSYVPANTIQIESVDATNQINTEADTALNDYDGPTNTELNARTVTAATYATASALATAQADLDLLDTGAELQTLLFGGSTAGTTVSTNVAAIIVDTAAMDTSGELQTLLFGSATAGATASALSTAQSGITSILADTDAVDTSSELRTLLMGSNIAPASTTQAATAQADLDILTGTDGVTLATSQPNYAPYTGTPPTVGAIRTELEGAGTKLSLVLADTDEIQTRFGLMIEADGGDWRFDTNSLEQAPSGGGGGGDATAANQTTIINHLTDIKGATWSSSTDSLEALYTAIATIDGGSGAGTGDTAINHNTGGTDELRVVDGSGNGIVDATIHAYVASAFTSNPLTATVQATTTTSADGRWEFPMMLDSGTTYTLYIYKQGVYGPATVNVTP